MQTKTIGKAAVAGAVSAAVIALLLYIVAAPVAAQTASTTTQTSAAPSSTAPNSWGGGFQWSPGGPFPGGAPAPQGGRMQTQPGPNISVGEAITVTSTQGRFVTVGTSGENGTASGTLTFTVTGKLSQGYTLSLTGGSLVVGGSTYTVASGTAQMDPQASSISGQGSTSPSGQFILRASAQGSFVGSSGLVSIDLQSGSSEYLVTLTGNISS